MGQHLPIIVKLESFYVLGSFLMTVLSKSVTNLSFDLSSFLI
jgi:hypothetical protein